MKFDYNTIIGRDVELWLFHVQDVIKNAGLPRDEWQFNVYLYYNETIPQETTDTLMDICKEYDIKVEKHYEHPRTPFIIRLYNGWNRTQLMGATDVVIRGGSDQTFYPDSFKKAYEHYVDYLGATEQDCVINFQTIESPVAPDSRHFIKDFGSVPSEYKEKEFRDFCQTIIRPGLVTAQEALDIWGLPGPFLSTFGNRHYRGDGVSWIQSKELFQKLGPMPAMERGFTGDLIIHDRYERAGVPSFIAADAISYHFVKGERRLVPGHI